MRGLREYAEAARRMLNTWGGNPPPPAAKDLDLSHYQKALAEL